MDLIEYVMLNHYFIQLAFLDSWKSIVPVDKQIEVFRKIERTINQKAEKDGIFKLSVPFVLIDCVKN